LIDAGSPSSAPQRSEAQEAALQRALRYLSYRPRSEAEVRSHLRQRGCTATAIERSVERLRQLNYLNDGNFARSWAAAKVAGGYGPKRIEQELKAKGVGPAIIRAVVTEAFSEGEEAHARRLLEKRYRKLELNDDKTLRRAVAFLQRRGYSSKVIYDTLKYSVEDL
jgi:regulatory protein